MSSQGKKKYDHIIVGSGVAGITIAKKLLETDSKTTILMLEAGPPIPAKDRRSWWDYVTLDKTPYAFTYDGETEARSVGKVNWITNGARVKAVGGSTMHWGAWALRFKPEDFQLYTNTGEGGDWPISYDDLEDYYFQAEEYLSVCGDETENWSPRKKPYPMPPFKWTAADGVMIEAFTKLGIKPGKMPLARYRKCFTTGTCKYCPFGSRFSAVNVLNDMLDDPRYAGLELRSNSPTVRVHAQSKAKIEAVEYVDNVTGKTIQEHAHNFIICSGAYETPKLLMNSKNKYWTRGIGNDADLLGRFIISHSMLKVRGSVPENKERWFQEYDFPTLMSRTHDSPERQKMGKIFLFKNRVLPYINIAKLMIDGRTPEEIDKIVSGPMELELQAFMEEKGKFDNRLQRAEGRDRFGLPLTTINFNRTDAEEVNARENLNLMTQVIVEMGYKVMYAKTEDPGAHHTTGTCRMGKTAEDSVTDANLKVHDTDNLYLCSTGVFPSGSAVNPTLTLTALSIRLADHLTGKEGKASFERKEVVPA
jgi:choline dehydrogenase-like flavoprotein